MWGDMVANFSPPGAVNFKHSGVVVSIQQGNTAIVIEGAPLGGRINDPKKSKVRGKLGYRVVPKGPGGRHPAFAGHGIGIASTSKKVEPAWLFMQWALSKEVTLDIALNSNHSAVSRNSELLSKVVFELKIKRQSGFQESPRFHQRIVHLQSPLPGNQSHVTFSNSFLRIVPA